MHDPQFRLQAIAPSCRRTNCIRGRVDYFLILWVLLILVILHRSIAPWLNLSNGEAIAIGLVIICLGNLLGLVGFFRLLKAKLSRDKSPKIKQDRN